MSTKPLVWLNLLLETVHLTALFVVQVGGILVYSTCSFNPIEDEAVVADVLRRTNGSIELVDVSDKLTGLKKHPGLKTWQVRDMDRWVSSHNVGQNAQQCHTCTRCSP